MGKEEIKLSLFANDMILYIQDTTKNLLELINDFSKLTGQKINIPKSVAKNALTERQVKKKLKKVQIKKAYYFLMDRKN